MREPKYTSQFKKDIKLQKKRKKDMEKLKNVMQLLIDEKPLPEELKDHALVGNWKPCRDLHIEPDWVLIYSIDGNEVCFERTGTHSDLF